DATSVPADRGGVGRYVDGLLGALGKMDVDLAVVCQRTDAERYGRQLPSAKVIAAPSAAAHRPARLAWEQTGLPVLAQQVGAKEPRKNVPSLVRGWVAAVTDRENPPALVVAGGQGHDDDIDQAFSEVPPHLRLLRPGYLRYADLPGFLGGALVAAYPSYGEGF